MTKRTVLAVSLAVCCFTPVLAHFYHAQSQLLLLGLLSIALSLRKSRPMLADVLYGFLSGLKLFTLPLVLVSLVRRGTKGGALFLAGLSLAVALGGGFWIDFLQNALPYIQEGFTRFNANVSLTGAIAYVLSPELQGKAYTWIIPCVGLIALGALGRKRFSGPDGELDLVAFIITGTLLLSPITWNHYLVLAIFPLLLLCSRLKDGKTPEYIPVLIAYFLLTVGQGRLTTLSIAWQVTSPFIAPMGLVLMLLLLYRWASKKPAL